MTYKNYSSTKFWHQNFVKERNVTITMFFRYQNLYWLQIISLELYLAPQTSKVFEWLSYQFSFSVYVNATVCWINYVLWSRSHYQRANLNVSLFILINGWSKGRKGRAPPPLGQNFFILMQFPGKIGQIVGRRPPSPIEVAHLPWEILYPPLLVARSVLHIKYVREFDFLQGSVFVLISRLQSSSSSSELGQVKYIWTVFVLDLSWPTSLSLLTNHKTYNLKTAFISRILPSQL